MKNIKKINNKGFMLAETLIVSLFVLSVFSMLYINILPLVAEYEKYRNYNTVEATYRTHWARKIALDGLNDEIFNKVATNKSFYDITDCSLYTKTDKDDMESWCNNYKYANDIEKIYLTSYSLENFKEAVSSSSVFSRSFKEYVDYLPIYSKNTTKANDNKYFHIIVEYDKNDKYNYGIIELYKKN